MTFDEFDASVNRTLRKPDTFAQRISAWALGITGEGGEVADLVKKFIAQGHSLDYPTVLDELGDVLFYISAMAQELGYDLEAVAEMNRTKLLDRYPDGFSEERSKNRK